MGEIYPSLAQCAIVAAALKILLFPAYKSTDFEVHRNWLAITHSLPLWEWYYEKTSEWTLDYPPFFAYFEWVMSQVAKLVDPAMLRVWNLEYGSWETVYFQRCTVIVTELVLVYALQMFVDSSHGASKRAAQAAAISILLSPGLLIIDHIHFQYNGCMYGLLIASLVLARKRSGLLASGLLFAALLCMKHIYLYLAPAYFVFLLRAYCLSPKNMLQIQFLNCLKLGGGIAAILGTAFGPFALKGQIPQILSRLFPFSRGLCHAYWAPNVWAVYSFLDRVLIMAAPRIGLPVKVEALQSVTRGLVGDTSFAVLPDITPRMCFALTLLFQAIPLVKLFFQQPPAWDSFIGAVTLCGYASFLFGWHVHEKAVLLVIIPFSLIALKDRRYLSAFRPLAVAGHVSLFPLLFTPAEFPIKTVYTIFWLVLFLMAFDRLAPASSQKRLFLFDRFSTIYITISIPLIFYCSLLHGIIFGKSYEFLPLMFTSSYSAIGVVLFKRKPVQFLTVPQIEDDQQEVWHIPQTGEIFVSYDDYLNRMDFYKQKRFICTITGHSGLNFFEALQSELEGAEEVEQAFPEPLKGPVLRRVQFQTVSRIDALVDQIYDEFKNDYYPGEAVTVHVVGGERLQGVVRDKTRFGSKVLPDGTITPPFSRYIVSLEGRSDKEAVVDDAHIFRDRKVFTKSILRSFIKKTVTREAWNGAPWLVKHDVADQYHIDTRIPPYLRYDNKLLERKQIQAQKRMSQSSDAAGGMGGELSPTGPTRLPELKPAPKSHKSKAQQAALAAQQQHGGVLKNRHSGGLNGHEPGKFMHMPLPGNPFQFPTAYRDGSASHPSPVVWQPEPPPPPPPPKYPIEDLQLEPRGRVRPQLKYMCSDLPVKLEDATAVTPLPYSDKILMKSIGPLLETWDTLNVYCEIFKLDSFTFDDYVEAMQIASEDVQVQLYDEIHCAVLKVLVSSEKEGGKVQIQLPELEDEEEEEEEEEESTMPTPEPEPQPKGRATRSSMAKLEAERLAAEIAAAEKQQQDAEDAPKHRAEDVLKDYDWIEHLRKRDFKEGGWELIMVGLLHQLSKNERQKANCEELLQQLVPIDVEPSRETVRQRYASLDINYRVQALQIICMLTAETKAIRGYMEDCSEQMTAYRKEKIEWQRKRKQAIEELKGLNDQRKILLPDNMPPSPPLEATKTNGDVKMSDVEDATPIDASDEVADSDDEPVGRKLRRGHDRAAERKRKAEKEQERKEKAEAAAKVPKQSKQFLKVLKDIAKKEAEITECENEIAIIDNDLREADCPRTRVLGKDRFWNRYYWFERNGMPYGGLPNSSTASAGYANGCIWVQGPDELEREGYIDMPPEYQNEYRARFNMTVPERKEKEEGKTSHVFNATQWGFYADPEEVDALLEWLDPRGFNEVKLRKEIVNYREKITRHMEKRKEYLAPLANKGEKKKEEAVVTNGTGNKRMSTRGRTAPTTPEPPMYRCLAWQNTMAIDELGHLHMEEPLPPPPPKETKGGSRKSIANNNKKKDVSTVVAAVPEPPEPVTTRGSKKRQSRG
ncbi:ALG6, ALG8 glycosyltransferase family-domain-containing protein [Diplogelasinospora grovesii]|uniref:ALG6, ALG8 glycosyltransferase family-domain-containing protein n=1 Tax=Diplogelasinospora grovesii TaxID=303347 RepID=A0AAN6S248_9PEZI|nr:ALG6, ALG8 glycosyltransferase family-domain-containing protein [Diplogelasinospora grovesii]